MGVSLAVALGLAAPVALITRALGSGAASTIERFPGWALLAIAVAEEVVVRGVIQRGLEETAERRGGLTSSRARSLAALASLLLGLVAARASGGPPIGILLVSHGAAALTRAITGRNSASILTRTVALAAALAWGPIGR
jgi:hypothetical protein